MPLRPAASRRHGADVVSIALLVVALGSLVYRLDRPGLEYDETNFVPASLGGSNPSQGFVSTRFAGVPVMVMPYIGALKSWLYAPLLAGHQGSPWLVRLPVVLIGLLTLVVLWLLSRRLLGPVPAALVVFLAASAQGFLWTTRVDWGPNAIAALCRVSLLSCLLLLVRRGHARYAAACCLVLALGVFNKQDFVLSGAALVLAALGAFPQQFWLALKGWTRAARLSVAALGALLLVEIVALVGRTATASDAGGGQLQNPVTHVIGMVRRYARTYAGDDMLAFFSGRSNSGARWPLVLVACPVLLAGVASASLIRRRTRGDVAQEVAREYLGLMAFLVTATVLLLGGLAATRQATGPHHAIQLWPFAPLLVGVAIAALAAGRAWTPARGRAVLAGLMLLAVSLQVGVELPRARQLFELTGSPERLQRYLSTDIYAVDAVVRSYLTPNTKVLSVDWGSGTQLLTLACPHERYLFGDLWPTFSGDDAGLQRAVRMLLPAGASVIVVSAATDDAPGPGLRGTSRLVDRYRLDHPQGFVQPLYRSATWDVTWFGPTGARRSAAPGCGTS
jgi:4-amino-4-deoxy-L-arabinose transferase-like glycosyltransferase